MIYGKIWCVVKPSVGVPIIIGAVALASFSVHLALTLNTTWVKRFLNGSAAQVSVAPSEAIQPVAALTIPNTLRK
jgi:light-harvesting protein B-800-850 alpha chain